MKPVCSTHFLGAKRDPREWPWLGMLKNRDLPGVLEPESSLSRIPNAGVLDLFLERKLALYV
jgi:hypothetical protein